MMLAWSFSARAADEIARLVRALGKHRYVHEVDHRIHWAVDRALADHPAFAPHAAAFAALRKQDPALDPGSRDPRLWRAATADDAIAALSIFWTPDAAGEAARERLLGALLAEKIPTGDHEPWSSAPDDPPHPELILLDWVLLPVDELDDERHAGALLALEESGEEINPSAPIYQEGPILAAPELTRGAPNGVLPDDFLVWSEGPYIYADYVFRGASKAAKLVDPPVSYFDLDLDD
jgi:hypothetical protein